MLIENLEKAIEAGNCCGNCRNMKTVVAPNSYTFKCKRFSTFVWKIEDIGTNGVERSIPIELDDICLHWE